MYLGRHCRSIWGLILFRKQRNAAATSRTVLDKGIQRHAFTGRCLRQRISCAAATDEMHQLEPVTFMQDSGRPSLPTDDLAIELRCHPVSLHAKLLDKLCKRERGGKFALIAIQNDLHVEIRIALLRGATQAELARGVLAVVSGLHQDRGLRES